MTMSGKIERLYFGAKGLFIAPLAAWMYFHGNPERFSQYSALLGVYILINLVIYWLNVKRLLKGSATYFPLTLIDLLFVFFIVSNYTQGNLSYFILFYYITAMLSLFRPPGKMIIAGCGFSAAIVLLSIPPYGNRSVTEIAMSVFYIWLVGIIGFLISHYINSSEKRLLRTLDILNERTWELESSQSMLENMYETTRALSSILDINQLLNEVLKVANDVLGVRRCLVLLAGPAGSNLSLYAELDHRKKYIYNPPKIIAAKKSIDLASYMAVQFNERLIIGGEKSQRLLELPLMSHGKVLGLLQIEPQTSHQLVEKDRKNFTILANSTAIAIDNALLHMKMQELTIIDELTGLYNYRFFRLKLTDEIRRADRYHQPLSILMIDVDHFKNINDSQGHQIGNIILQEIVSIIKHSVRDVDIVARYGGEEFMVLLPQTSLKSAMNIAERMRVHVERSFFTNAQGQRDVKATISIGAAIYPNGIVSGKQLLEKVDQALYQAKNNGRNQVGIVDDQLREKVKQKNE